MLILFALAWLGLSTMSRQLDEVTAQRDSIMLVHQNALERWAKINRELERSTAMKAKAYAEGDDSAAYEAGVHFGYWLGAYNKGVF